MRLLFMLLIGTLAASDILQTGMSLGPGLSVKNALLYPIALGLLFRIALKGNFRMRLPTLNAAFVIWVVYATITWAACSTVIHYPGYEPLNEAVSLKSVLWDSAIYFFTYFYGTESEEDFFVMAKTLAFAVGIANILTLADVVGIVHLGITVGSTGVEADRVFGVFGHANDTGALMVCLLPMLAAVATSSRGAARVFWYGGALASVAVLLLTVSRGAYVGLAVGYAAALWLCRRHLPTSRVVAWTLIGLSSLAVALAVAALVMPGFTQVLSERLFNQSMSVSISDASSGRTTIWLSALSLMAAHPITFLTGFGWNVYHLMFTLVTHNYYLDEWFGLGLPGLLGFLTILYVAVATARRAVPAADPRLRPYMIAFVFGILGLSVCIFFVNLDKPWSYVWIYVGFALRAASDAVDRRQKASARETALKPAGYSPGLRAPAARGRLIGELRR